MGESFQARAIAFAAGLPIHALPAGYAFAMEPLPGPDDWAE